MRRDFSSFSIVSDRILPYFVSKSITMKSILLTIAFGVRAFFLFAQDDVFSNKTNMALEKVIRDFPNRFHNIKGEMLSQHAQYTDFRSTIQVPGFATSIITKYNIPDSDTYSWSCTAIIAKDFATAKNKYQEIYDEIENTIIKVDGQKPFIVSGQFRTPYEGRKMNNIVFELLPAVGDMKSLKIDLLLEKDLSGWKVVLNVYDGDHKVESYTSSK
jgi:hypothetical protein